jgi:signal transduction histidine kinase
MKSAQVTTAKTKEAGRVTRLFHSVRFRLSLWYVAILAVVVVVFGSVIYSVEATSLSGEIDAELKLVAERIPQALSTEANSFKLSDQLTQLLNQVLGQKSVIPEPIRSQIQGIPLISNLFEGKYVMALVDSQDNLTQSFGAFDKASLDDLRQNIAASTAGSRFEVFTVPPSTGKSPSGDSPAQDYRVYIHPVDLGNGIKGTVVAGLPWEGAATLRVLLITLLLTGTITLVLAAAGGYWLASRAMRPVSDITRTARNISETDLSRRLNNPRQDEIGELAGTFDQMLGRLEAGFERQRQFTADASHELRTPLTIINLEVNRSLARPRPADEYVKALEVIEVENEYMTRLVEDLLLLARADAGQSNLQPEKLDLSDLALEVAERLEPLAERQNIDLLTGELPEIVVEGDRRYLTQMVANLVENAIKYTAGTGDTVRVETGCEKVAGTTGREGWAWLRVSDNGPGIAAEDLPYLFDRFYQADPARTTALAAKGINGPAAPTEDPTRGSGLGLSIVKWVVEAHQGTITARSQPGKGATFEVRLPLNK